jgi:hypothetical protein
MEKARKNERGLRTSGRKKVRSEDGRFDLKQAFTAL